MTSIRLRNAQDGIHKYTQLLIESIITSTTDKVLEVRRAQLRDLEDARAELAAAQVAEPK